MMEDVTLELGGCSDYAVRQLIKGKSYFCTWQFRHRDADGYVKSGALSEELQSYIGDRATLGNDQSVNHPDFYDSRMFSLDKVEVAILVRDNSTLGSTFIFVEPRIGT